MNESQRTIVFVVVAALSVVAARFAGPSVPKPTVEVTGIGEAFYPDFKDADAAKSLEVATYNADSAEVRQFGVAQGKDGIWRVPTRYNYPVDGKDRLAKMATSVISLKRETFAGRRETEHAEFGVLDPRGEAASDLKGIGNRITLKDAEGKVLADYIIGKEVKGRTGTFYVRRPDEKATYSAKLDIQLSTKFSDWIEADLLKLDSFRLNSITIDKHSLELTEEGGRLTGKETNELTKATSADKWKLTGLDEATEEVNEEEVRKLVSALDDLRIVGVRPKSPRLKQSLLAEKGITPDRTTMIDLRDSGFFLIPTKDEGGFMMVSQEGDLTARTDQGVVYDLHFGAVFSATEDEAETGLTTKSEDKEKKPEEEGKADGSAKPKQKNRYLFVMARFDEAGLGAKPELPVKPEAPAEGSATEDGPADAVAPTNTTEDPKKAYEAALAKYEADQKKYTTDVKARDDKIKEGEKLVKELNTRFADWYYVVSGESFENLRQGRKTLVKAKGATDKPADPAGDSPILPPQGN